MDVPYRQIRAVYTETQITVYQAYEHRIAEFAAKRGRFPDSWSRQRMTWIKPSFLWMMYRSGWATKPQQERVIAIEIQRSAFEWALENSCLSHYEPASYADRHAWSARLRQSPVRIQWDPERNLALAPLPHRSLQVGLSGEAARRFADDWIVSIVDVTDLCHRVHALVREGSVTEAVSMLPTEVPYPLKPNLAQIIGASSDGSSD